MRKPLALQPRHVGEEGHHIGRRQPGDDAVVRGGDAERADAGRRIARKLPQLARQLGGRGFAVGAGDRNGAGGKRPEERRRGARERPARLGVGDVERAGDVHLGAGHPPQPRLPPPRRR